MTKYFPLLAKTLFILGVLGAFALGTVQAVERRASDCEVDLPTYIGVACLVKEDCETPCKTISGAWWWDCENLCCVCGVR